MEPKKPRRIDKMNGKEHLQYLLDEGIQCYYVRFQAPVSPKENKEPVYEFKLECKDPRYKVDEISHDNYTLYWKIDGVIQETPWVNVQWARPILD